MSVFRHIRFLHLLTLIAIFPLAGCTTHDNVTTASMPAEPVATAPVATPEPATPDAPATPAAPEPAKPAEPAATTPTAPEASAPSEAKPNDTFTLKPGQSATVTASTKLHYVRMVNDSRCPPDVQCIWAGEVTIELTLDSGKEKQTFTMKDHDKPATVSGYSIELISIDRNHLINVRVKKI